MFKKEILRAILRAKKMILSVTCLPCKHKDLHLVTSTHRQYTNTHMCMCTCTHTQWCTIMIKIMESKNKLIL